MLHKIPSLFPWKHNKTKIMAEPVLEEVNLQEQLAPCGICGRTFLPGPLSKHTRICEKNANKKRKIFNSLKQRVEGTDLAPFHQRTYLKKPEPPASQKPVETKSASITTNAFKDKHHPLLNSIRTASKGSTSDSEPAPLKHRTMSPANLAFERCPSCDRQFGPKAFDRHVEWCKERRARLPPTPANVTEAKERLDARIKYRVPPSSKSKKTVKEKYQSPGKPELPTVRSTSCLDRQPSVRKSGNAQPKRLSHKSPEPMRSEHNARPMKSPEIKGRKSDLKIKEQCCPQNNIISEQSKNTKSDNFSINWKQSDGKIKTLSSSSSTLYSPKFLDLIDNINNQVNAKSNTVLNVTIRDCKRLVKLSPRKFEQVNSTGVKLPPVEVKELVKSSTFLVLPKDNTKRENDNLPPIKPIEIENTDIEETASREGSYNPILTAERQLMELLECDDFKPFKSSSPSAHQNHSIVKPKLAPKSAKKITPINQKNNRASVIEPPCDFKDDTDIYDDNFELIENFINDNFNNENILDKLDFETISLCSKTSITSHNAVHDVDGNYNVFSDELSIDPRLINEYDNLSIPEHLTVEDTSPNDILPQINTKYFTSESNKIKNNTEPLILPKTEKSNECEISDFIKSLADTETRTNEKNKCAKLPKNSQQAPCSHGHATSSPDKKMNLSALRRTMSILDPVKPKNLKNKEDVQNYFDEQELKYGVKKELPPKTEVISQSPPADAELFCIDDEMYEEYKRYEQTYLREKEEKEEKLRKFHSEDEAISKISGDSAYGSLSRNKPKVRSKVAKLSPLDQRVDSASSSGSDSGVNKQTSMNVAVDSSKLSKFCHECGNKHPLTTAKFCVECGVRRLVL